MSEALKPVRCGCGGEAYYEAYENYNFGSYIAQIMICEKCGMRTAEWPSEAEAIEAWNKAMGERTAKVVCNGTTMGLSFCCGNCGKPVHSEGEYCHHCGAKLEWSDHE